MPKVKSHSGASKRFRMTKNGKIKRAQMGKNHILTKKNRKRIRDLRQGAYVDKSQEKTVKKLLPYA